LYDSRIPRGNPRFGPFKTIQEFHFWLRRDLKPEDLKDREKDQDWHVLQDMMSKQDGPWPLPSFTHGDLNPFNVLVYGAMWLESLIGSSQDGIPIIGNIHQPGLAMLQERNSRACLTRFSTDHIPRNSRWREFAINGGANNPPLNGT
jgi:hypothetical protein